MPRTAAKSAHSCRCSHHRARYDRCSARNAQSGAVVVVVVVADELRDAGPGPRNRLRARRRWHEPTRGSAPSDDRAEELCLGALQGHARLRGVDTRRLRLLAECQLYPEPETRTEAARTHLPDTRRPRARALRLERPPPALGPTQGRVRASRRFARSRVNQRAGRGGERGRESVCVFTLSPHGLDSPGARPVETPYESSPV
eukprot:scaffold689_cov375-Prasinococcus_capsulatus_cf.AAC.12